jgi:hypothetical protein
MGAFITSYHVRSAEVDAVRAALIERFAQCWMGPCEGGWISFYEGEAIEMGEIPKTISKELGCAVIGFNVTDSDFLCYVLCDTGWELDVYNSWPYCCDGIRDPGMPQAEKDRLKGRADVLLEYCPPGTDYEALESLLQDRAQEFAFAEEHLAELAKLMGINPERARITYRDVGIEFEPEEMQLEFVGGGMPITDGPDRWRGLRVVSMDQDVEEVIADENPNAVIDVRMILDQMPTPERRLQMAVAFEQIDEVRRLLDDGADPTGVENAPLITAISKDNRELIDLLLDRGPDLTVVEQDGGMTVLHHAACEGDATIVQRLIGLGCDVNAIDDMVGSTPLHRAIENAAAAVVETLLKSGADPLLKDGQGKDAHQLAEDQLQLLRTAKQRWEEEGRRYPKDDELPELERCVQLLRDAVR